MSGSTTTVLRPADLPNAPSELGKAMSENDKDWGNPIVLKIYLALAMADLAEPDDNIVNWLNRNGFCNLTVCPLCHVDDFVHVEGCQAGLAVDAFEKTIEQHGNTIISMAETNLPKSMQAKRQ